MEEKNIYSTIKHECKKYLCKTNKAVRKARKMCDRRERFLGCGNKTIFV